MSMTERVHNANPMKETAIDLAAALENADKSLHPQSLRSRELRPIDNDEDFQDLVWLFGAVAQNIPRVPIGGAE